MRTRVVGNRRSDTAARSARKQPHAGPTSANKDTHVPTGDPALEPQLLTSKPAKGTSEVSDAIPAMTLIFAPDAKCIFASRRWLKLRGRVLKQERGDGWLEGLHPEDRDRCAASFRAAFAARQPVHMKFRIRRVDGSYSWAWAQSAPHYLDDGTLSGYRCELREFELEASHPALETLANSNARQKPRLLLCEIAAKLKQSGSVAMLPAKMIAGEPARRISAEAVIESFDVSVTPMIILDAHGGAVLSNMAFETFAARALATTTANAAGFVGQNADPHEPASSDRTVDSATRTLPGQAWLESNWIYNEQDFRIVAQPLGILGGELTAFSIIDLRSEKQIRMQERAFLHDLLNTATGIQMLIDLFSAETSRDERDEYVKLLHASMNLLLSKIDQERTLLDKLCAAPVQIGAVEESGEMKLQVKSAAGSRKSS
jgi:PAS fold